jgi:hypothetical protein
LKRIFESHREAAGTGEYNRYVIDMRDIGTIKGGKEGSRHTYTV